jgi:hypothetical protein
VAPEGPAARAGAVAQRLRVDAHTFVGARGGEASAVVTTPNVLCLHEPGFDETMLDQVLDMGAGMDGIPADVEVPFDLSWDVTLTAKPVGNFVNLRPPPPGQGPQGNGPAPQGPANGARR